MAGLFQALELGKRALLSHQINLQTIGHNIANVNTPGYTRQRVSNSATMPENSIVGSVGTGVQVNNIRHIRDLFLGKQYREDNKALGQWQYKDKILTQIESLFGEPNKNTISDMLNKFWDSWSQLSTDNSVNGRDIVLTEAALLASGIRDMAGKLDNLRSSIDRDLVNITKEVNLLTSQIAKLNQQIKSFELGDTQANDLRDSRDLLIDQLSTFIDVNTIDKETGETTVLIGSMAIVDGGDAILLGAYTENVNGKVQHELRWKGTSITVTNLNGQMAGLMESRDTIIPNYIAELDKLASTLVEQVNAIHNTGYGLDGSTGLDFFDDRFLTAATIRISSDIDGNQERVAASLSGEVGDNRIALAIADLRNATVMNSGTTTINDFYSGMIGRLGVETREATSLFENYELLLSQVDNARQSVQGVSLDEEMVSMIRYQHAYDAAARVITTIDQALDTVINRMGIVGR